MSIRQQYKARDIQDCIVKLIDSWGAPWDRWTIVYGWPDVPLNGDFGPYVYIMLPEEVSKLYQMGGTPPLRLWNMTVGFWLSRASGGSEEQSVWISEMQYRFDDPATLHDDQFTVTLGTTTYTNTNLKTQGIYVRQVSRPSAEMGEDKREFRREMELLIKA